MEEESIVWEGNVDKGKWLAQVVGIPNNEYRGILKIMDSDGNVRYQREVSVSSRVYFGPERNDVKEWSKVILDWVDNFS